MNSFGMSIDPDYRSSTNTVNPLKSLAVLIGVDRAQPIAAATSTIAKKSPSGKSIPDWCMCNFEALFCFDRVSIVMCDFDSVRFTELCSGDVAQATHWFDYKKMWPETAKVLHKGGTAKFWVCPDLNLLVRLFIHNILTFSRYILNHEPHPIHLSTPSSQRMPKAKILLHP